MKRLILIAVLVAAFAALLAGTALAAGPVTPPAQGFGRGTGIQAQGAGPGTGMMTPGAGMRAGGMMGRGATAWAGQTEEVATLLGMSAADIQAERLAGKSLVQIAASKNPPVSEDTLISTIIEARTTDLAALVTAGKLTQAQMDLMVEHVQTQVKTMLERTSVGPAFDHTEGAQSGGQERPGGMMGQGFRGGRGANR